MSGANAQQQPGYAAAYNGSYAVYDGSYGAAGGYGYDRCTMTAANGTSAAAAAARPQVAGVHVTRQRPRRLGCQRRVGALARTDCRFVGFTRRAPLGAETASEDGALPKKETPSGWGSSLVGA